MRRVERFTSHDALISAKDLQNHASQPPTMNNTAQPERQCPSYFIHVASHDDVSPVGNSVLMRRFPKYTKKYEPNVLKCMALSD